MKWFRDVDKATGGEQETGNSQSQADQITTATWTNLQILLPVLALTSASLFGYHLYARNLRRYATIDHLPAAIYTQKSPRGLLGQVTSVGDGDNFRFFHTPGGRLAGWGWLRSIPSEKKDLKGQTIHVRIAGVDAPELAHFGKPAQPYGQEALDWLRNYLLGRRVRVLIHSRDRFDRVVANPKIRTWPWIWVQKDVGVEQIKVGLATVFRQGGAEYGGLLEVMEAAEKQAKAARRGMWARGKRLETPADYKKRTREGDMGASPGTNTSTGPSSLEKQGPGTFSKTLSWLRWSIGSSR